MECVKLFMTNFNPATIKKATKNDLKRARLCLESVGGHAVIFQTFILVSIRHAFKVF